MKHIYVGMSHKVYCGEKLGTKHDIRDKIAAGRLSAPITEGEYVDGFGFDHLCAGCVEAIEPVRGKPVIP